MQQWEGLAEFVAVVETGSFTKASRRLNISTAQVSRQISQLEQRMAVKLLYRTTRKVSVTEAGQLYYQHCRPLLDGLEEAERAVTQLQSTPKGKLNLTAPIIYGEQIIAPLINDFACLYPELDIRLQLTNQQLDLVESGTDLAIRLGRLHDSSMMARRLTGRQLHLCASPDYIESHGVPHTLSELNQHNCLLGTLDYWRFNDMGQERQMKLTGSIRCNSGNALLDAALKHIGIVQLPDFYVRQVLEEGKLKELLKKHRPSAEGVWALYPHNRQLSPKVRLLTDFLAEALKSNEAGH